MSSNVLSVLDQLNSAAEAAKTPSGSGRIVFGIDATGSREAQWETARRVQSAMFTEAAKFGSLSLQLVYFHGADTCRASRWTSSADVLAQLMSSIHCQAGGTQINKVLSRAIAEHEKAPISALVYIGDAQEEQEFVLRDLAHQLKCPAFFFQEGEDSYVTRQFRDLATITKGGFAFFDSSAPATLSELLKAVAAFATGGLRALRAQGTEAATLLLSQLK